MIRPKRRSPNSKAREETHDSISESFAATAAAAAAMPLDPPKRSSSFSLSDNSSHISRSLTLAMGGSMHERRTISPRKSARKSSRKTLEFRKKRRIRRGFGYWCRRERLFRMGLVMGGLFVVSFGMAFLAIHMMHPAVVQPNIVNKAPAAPFPGGSTTAKVNHLPRGNQIFHSYSKSAPLCTQLTSPEEVTFTLVTQFSDDRLWMMEYHCQRWQAAPMSVAVFTERSEEQVRQDLQNLHCPVDLISIATVGGYSQEEYPVNVLRNTALKAVETTHVVYVDIDFWESTDLSHTLHLHRDVLYADPKAALVVPAFQLNRQCKEWRDCRENNIPVMPKTRIELLDLMFDRKADPFDPTNKGGHGTTRYMDWFDQPADQLLPIECIQSNRYEPYLVFRYCHDLPPFQVAFSGYGKNKMTWVMHLRRAGYKFWQIGESFVVHYPHLDSKSRMHWNGGEGGLQMRRPKDGDVDWLSFKRGQIDHTFILFRKWLNQHVKDAARTPMCKDAMDDDQRLWVDKDQLE